MNKIIRNGLVAAGVAGALISSPVAKAQTISVNSGSVGAVANGVNSEDVILGLEGAIAGDDLAVGYSGGANTLVPFSPALNPAHTAPFTIEFWVKPSETTDNAVGPAPVFNRKSDGDRSGWVFFQRAPDTGWEFRMYSGAGSDVGFQIGGGTNAKNEWNHVVATWNGTSPSLFVDGVQVTNPVTGSGSYLSNQGGEPAPSLSLGAYDTGENPFDGSVDDFAFYHTALTLEQIQAHYNAASSNTPGAYSSLVLDDGAFVYLQNIPEPSTAALLLVGLLGAGGLKRHRRAAKA